VWQTKPKTTPQKTSSGTGAHLYDDDRHHHVRLFVRGHYGFAFGLSSSSGAELTLIAENFGILDVVFPFPSILDAADPMFNCNYTNILFDGILPSSL
jgi:hypothetical protein